MQLVLSSEELDEVVVVRAVGEVDVSTAPSLRRHLDDLIQRGYRDLVVDLTEVDFLDSTGLGVLVGRLKLLRAQGGQLRLAGVRDRVRKVLLITGLDRVFEISELSH
ncbi:MAG: STAS domain-containing protein [Dermatophilaceae bacterium]|mgnify:CR=1|nr:STAS domain-containing protein [Actinomycetales bacterium]MBP8880717.1 STAS domain-containing protein [Dermatophilaceae bacterium]MBP9918001.1 STAS domain-containing protein [Dermatophilaceae bacterium]